MSVVNEEQQQPEASIPPGLIVKALSLWHIIQHLQRIANDLKALAADLNRLHSDPKIAAAIQSNPDLAKLSADLSQKFRDLTEAVH